jgi:hypothetical protein
MAQRKPVANTMNDNKARTGERKIRICVATSYGATEEPRGPRYAAEIARMDPNFEVVFVDCVPRGRKALRSVEFRNLPNVTCKSWYFPWKGGGKPGLFVEKIKQRIAWRSFAKGGAPRTAGLSTRSVGLERMLIAERADLYFGFNIDSLLPVYNAARASGGLFMFDCHEIHAEMSYEQSDIERAMIRAVQSLCFPSATLVLAASPQAAEYIESNFGIRDVLPLVNCAPLTDIPVQPANDGFKLYWRNSTLDLGPRGLSDILGAMPLLPADITLYLQGRPAQDGQFRVENAIRELGIADRVVILPPYRLEDAVTAALPYTIGLSLESPASINLNLTTSNKFFEYAMAGLAIISSGTEGLRHIVAAADLGLLYQAGDPADLARQIVRLYEDPALLARLRSNARQYALGEGNLEFQLRLFRETFFRRVMPKLDARRANSRGPRVVW